MTASWLAQSSWRRCRRSFQVPEAIAPPLYVEHMAVMQQTVQDRRGQHFIAGKKLRPVADALVGGYQHAAALIAVADQAKKQRGLQAGHRLKAHLVDDQKPGVHIFLPASSARGQIGVFLQGCQKLLDPVEHHPEAVLHGLDTQRDGQMRFAHPGRALKQHGALLADRLAGGANAPHSRLAMERSGVASPSLCGVGLIFMSLDHFLV